MSNKKTTKEIGIMENYCSPKRIWKEKNLEYLKQMQKFLDTADNISDENLKHRVIIEMLKCDEILTRISEDLINKKMEIGNNIFSKYDMEKII